jgi:transposase
MTFKSQIEKIKHRFGCERITMVGDRGMIKSGQIEALQDHGFYYITAITKPQIDTLLDQGIIQMELFSEELCEIEYDDVRYILRRNPVRAKELEDIRKSKIEKIEDLIHGRNQYLDEHPRAVVTVAVSLVKELIERLKLTSFLHVKVERRVLSLICDDDALDEAMHLDGCYVIKSNVPRDAVQKEILHGRYKDLAYVESAFRDMKTNQLEVRPVNVRKASRTRIHRHAFLFYFKISA